MMQIKKFFEKERTQNNSDLYAKWFQKDPGKIMD